MVLSSMPVCPQNENGLHWQPQQMNQRRRGEDFLMLKQIDVGREHSQHQRDNSPGGNSRDARNPQRRSEHDLERAADENQFLWKRQIGWHDLQEKLGPHEMHKPCENQEHGQHDL